MLTNKFRNISFLLTWHHNKDEKYVSVSTLKLDIFSQLSLGSNHSGKFSKNGYLQKEPFKCIFQYSFSASVATFFEKCLWRNATFSTLAYYWLLNLLKINLFTRYFDHMFRNPYSFKKILVDRIYDASLFLCSENLGKFYVKHPK